MDDFELYCRDAEPLTMPLPLLTPSVDFLNPPFRTPIIKREDTELDVLVMKCSRQGYPTQEEQQRI